MIAEFLFVRCPQAIVPLKTLLLKDSVRLFLNSGPGSRHAGWQDDRAGGERGRVPG